MGLDGGTIPTRGELVQLKKKPEQKDKVADAIHKWSNCTIKQSLLEAPIVVCHLGMLFSKGSIVEMLLKKTNIGNCKQFQHIESLRDVREMQLTPNRFAGASSSPFVCPITGLEMNGKHKFVCLWQCGCVISERAMREVASAQCHKCGRDYAARDVVVINPNDEEFEILKQRMGERKALRKSLVGASKPDMMEKTGDGETSSSCVQVQPNKREHTDVTDGENTQITKAKKHKKDHKHKKEHKHKKHKKKHRASKSVDNETPKIHPGWSSILAKTRSY